MSFTKAMCGDKFLTDRRRKAIKNISEEAQERT